MFPYPALLAGSKQSHTKLQNETSLPLRPTVSTPKPTDVHTKEGINPRHKPAVQEKAQSNNEKQARKYWTIASFPVAPSEVQGIPFDHSNYGDQPNPITMGTVSPEHQGANSEETEQWPEHPSGDSVLWSDNNPAHPSLRQLLEFTTNQKPEPKVQEQTLDTVVWDF